MRKAVRLAAARGPEQRHELAGGKRSSSTRPARPFRSRTSWRRCEAKTMADIVLRASLLRPQVDPDALVDELQACRPCDNRFFALTTPARTILSKKLFMRASVMAPMPSFSASPESTMPYSFILAME